MDRKASFAYTIGHLVIFGNMHFDIIYRDILLLLFGMLRRPIGYGECGVCVLEHSK